MRLSAPFVVTCFSAVCAVADTATFEAAVWRGETAYVAIPEAMQGGAAALAECDTGDGVLLKLLKFDEVKYDIIEKYTDDDGKTKTRVTGKGTAPDVCREWRSGDEAKPTMVRITAAADAKPGRYEFGPLKLTVLDRVLPPAKEWKYFLDLWQHPWAVARYFGVEPFSPEHYAKMEPVWRNLAECGCKALTVTLLDLPWNHQCYDGYYSMVGRVKKADGKWEFDYSLFDGYVEFGRRCGLGPDIACYTMCPWRYRVTWREEVTGNGEQGTVERRAKMLPGTPEFEEYWGPFLVDFAGHLKEKGWFDDAYIAMDERSPEDVRKISDLIQKYAPGMKIAICGKTKPSLFDGIKIENFCLGLLHLRSDFLAELAPRREKGYKTTFYVCCTAAHPNTFVDSPVDEGFWLGAYPVMVGFDGFLRWAANSWPEDPYKDTSFKSEQWKAGDTFLIYPNGELSSHLISLRSGVVAAEKMRIMRETGDIEGEIKRLAAPYGFRGAVYNKIDFGAFRREVEAFVNKEVSDTPLRVMTYNIRYSVGDEGTENDWNERRVDLADIVVRENPDLIGFQEVLPDQMAFLLNCFPDYTIIGNFRNPGLMSGEASPVAFRTSRFEAVKTGTFWLSETPDEPGSKSWGAKFPRVCSYAVLRDKTTGKTFAFANTHTDHKSEEAREKGMLLIVERMKEFGCDSPIIFTGDHNCLEYEKPAVAISKILKDAMYLSETTPEGSWRTFNFWVWRENELSIADALKRDVRERSIAGDDSDMKRIDYIYVSPGTRVLAYRTIPETRPGTRLYPSDHFPTVAEVLLP